jgi:hypothetical protein
VGRLIVVVLVALSVVVAPPARAQQACGFALGFKALRDQIPEVVGDCLESEHFNAQNGNAEQRTTRGLLVWRKADNFTAFTDGYRSWVNGPNGLQQRLNSERFCWESNEPGWIPCGSPRVPTPAPTRPPLPPPVASLTLADIDGFAILVAHDGTFLGKLSSNVLDTESVCNEVGQYGSTISSESAYNTITATPPRIIYRDRVVGYLTKNPILAGGVDPDVLFATYRCARRR